MIKGTSVRTIGLFCCVLLLSSMTASGASYFSVSSSYDTSNEGLQVHQVNYYNEPQSTNLEVSGYINVPFVYIETSPGSGTYQKRTIGTSGTYNKYNEGSDATSHWIQYKISGVSDYVTLAWQTETDPLVFEYSISFAENSCANCLVVAALFVDINIHGQDSDYYKKYITESSTYETQKIASYHTQNKREAGTGKFAVFGEGTDKELKVSTYTSLGTMDVSRSTIHVNHQDELSSKSDYCEPQYSYNPNYDINQNRIAFLLEIRGALNGNGGAQFTMRFSEPGSLL